MKKILLIIFLIILVLVIVIFSIPFTRSLILKPKPGSTLYSIFHQQPASTTGIADGENNQPAIQSFPEPGIEKIKSDLIGRQIPGWSFDKLIEFKQAAITSIARSDERIDFRIDLHLLPYNAKEESYYDAQIFAIYLKGDDGWQLDKTEEIYIITEVLIPPGKWVTINSIPNCELQPDDKNNLLWTSKTWDYEIKSGPGIGEVTLPQASTYDVKASGKHPVRVKLKFRPLSMAG